HQRRDRSRAAPRGGAARALAVRGRGASGVAVARRPGVSERILEGERKARRLGAKGRRAPSRSPAPHEQRIDAISNELARADVVTDEILAAVAARGKREA